MGCHMFVIISYKGDVKEILFIPEILKRLFYIGCKIIPLQAKLFHSLILPGLKAVYLNLLSKQRLLLVNPFCMTKVEQLSIGVITQQLSSPGPVPHAH